MSSCNRVSLLTFMAAISLVSPALAKPTCSGPLKRSCLRTLYQCFNAKGTCMTEEQRGLDSSTATSCWANGATLVFELGPPVQTNGVSVIDGQVITKSSKGKTCFAGPVTISTDDTSFVTTTTWTVSRKKKTWKLVTDTTGMFNVTCPNGKVEKYTTQQLAAAAPRCGGMGGGCTAGTCP